ncbi:MAG: MCE family protein, partial [Actinomycetales bacterium]
MARLRLGLTASVTIAACVTLAAAGLADGSGAYQASVVLDTATGVVKGGPVRVNGFKAGEVQDITVVDGKAKVTFSLEDDFAPLHDGAVATIGWKAVLSERQLEITDSDGKDTKAAEIPDGGMLRGTAVAPVEVADVLATLDAPTRKKLQGTLGDLASTLKGSEKDANATIATAGPA